MAKKLEIIKSKFVRTHFQKKKIKNIYFVNIRISVIYKIIKNILKKISTMYCKIPYKRYIFVVQITM